MIAYLSGEIGWEFVSQILVQNPSACYAHAINLAEVYYVFMRRGGIQAAENAIEDLRDAGVIPREDFDAELWKEAASIKATYPLALPDGFCIALAKRIGGTVLTTDHREMDTLVPLNIVPIAFIR